MSKSADNLGYLLSKAAKITRWDLNNKLAVLGLTAPQWAVLKDLSTQEECQNPTQNPTQNLTPASIADRLNADRPTISGIIERMEKQDWVYRMINPEDRRSYIIKLTDKAKEQMLDLERTSDATMHQAVTGFSQDEIQTLKKYLTQIINNF